MTGKIKRRSLRCGGRPKADFGSLFTSVIAPTLNAAGSIADSAIDKHKTPTSGVVNSNTVIPSDPTKTPTMRLGGRKRCWIGAAIGAATSIAGSLFGAAAQKREMRRQKSIQDWQNTTQEAAAMSTALNNSRDYQEDYLRQFRTAARLGKRLGAKGIYITDGGDATKIDNNTYLLRGGSHEDVNETGQTGIGINVGGNEVEAEGGEVAQKKNGALRIFSAQPILGNGMSPAQAILRGYNKDSVFNAQQAFKRRNGLKDDGSKARHGTAVPYSRIHINDDGTFTDTLDNKNYTTSATNGEDVVITGKANRWKEAGKRLNSKYIIPSSLPEMAKRIILNKMDNWVDRNVFAPNNYNLGIIRNKLFYNLNPEGYAIPDENALPIYPEKRIKDALSDRNKGRNLFLNGTVKLRNPIYAKYLSIDSIPTEYGGKAAVNDILTKSKYQPTKGNEHNDYYKSTNDYYDEGDYTTGPLSDTNLAKALQYKTDNKKSTFVMPNTYDNVMGAYTVSFGKDRKGKYMSYYDKWDLNPFEDTVVGNEDLENRYNIGKAVHLYNRRYYTDKDSINVMNKYRRFRNGFKLGGGLTSKDRGSSKHPYPSVSSKDFAGGGRSYPIPTKADAVDALRLAGLHGRSDVKAKVYDKYPSLRKKSLLGSSSRPVKGMRPKAPGGMYIPFNKRYTSIYDAPDYDYDYDGGNALGDSEAVVTAKRIKPTFMKPNNDAMNLVKVPKEEEVPYIPQRHNRSRTIFSGGDYLGLGIDTLAALSTGLVNYNTVGKYVLPDRAPIIQASKLPTTYNIAPEVEEVKRYRDRLTGETYRNTSSSVAALNRAGNINLDALSNLSKLWATKENEENKMLTEDAKNQQTVAIQNAQNELARQSEIARIKNEAMQARGEALNVGLSGLSQAWTNFWTAGRTAYEDDQARRAMIASSKEATPTRLMEMNFDLSPDLIASLYKTAKDDRTKRFYLSRLSPKQRQKYGIN